MLIQTRGIVFRQFKYSETSIIADIFTESLGLATFLVNGVRSSKSKISAGLLQICTLIDIVAYHHPEKTLHRLKEIHAGHIYKRLPFEVVKSAIGVFMLEVARRAIREQEANPALFQFLWDVFVFLDAQESHFNSLHLSYLVHLSAYLGFQPTDNSSMNDNFFDMKEGIFTNSSSRYTMSLVTSQLFKQSLRLDWRDSHLLSPLPRETRRLFLEDLLSFYRLQIENFPEIQSLKVFQEVFEH